MIYQLFKQMDQYKNPRLFKYGEQKRDFIYVKDVVNANIKAALSKNSGIYNVGTGKARTFNDIVTILNIEMNKKLRIEYFDNPYDFYQNYTEVSIENDIDYKPQFTLEEGIGDYIKYLNKDKVLGILIPYRNRKQHLDIFIPYIKKFLKFKQIKYKIYIIDQDDFNGFNKGLLLNIGIKYFFDEVDYICTHNIDTLPDINSDYSYTYKSIHLCNYTIENTYDTTSIIKSNNINLKKLFSYPNFLRLLNKCKYLYYN